MNIRRLLLRATMGACIHLVTNLPALAVDIERPLEASLEPGSMLVAHETPVILHTDTASINIAPGAVAFVIDINNEIAVLTLNDLHGKDVNVQVGDKDIVVPIGEELILAPAQEKFKDTAVSKCAEASNAKFVDSYGGTSVFRADFSYISALDNCPQFQDFINSKAIDEKKIAYILIKTAAALQAIDGK